MFIANEVLLELLYMMNILYLSFIVDCPTIWYSSNTRNSRQVSNSDWYTCRRCQYTDWVSLWLCLQHA